MEYTNSDRSTYVNIKPFSDSSIIVTFVAKQ